MLEPWTVQTRIPPDLRERLLENGPSTLSDCDLLTVVLGTGTGGTPVQQLARELLQLSAGLDGLLQVSGHGLATRHGVGPAKAARIVAGLELGRRAMVRALDQQRPALTASAGVADWARPRLATLEHEEVWLLTLDGRNGLKSAQRIAQGGLHACALTPPDVLRPALRDAASSIILVHNHPSGDPTPSPEDVQMTRAVAMACDLVGVPLLDHVVVARQGASSLLELGLLPR